MIYRAVRTGLVRFVDGRCENFVPTLPQSSGACESLQWLIFGVLASLYAKPVLETNDRHDALRLPSGATSERRDWRMQTSEKLNTLAGNGADPWTQPVRHEERSLCHAAPEAASFEGVGVPLQVRCCVTLV